MEKKLETRMIKYLQRFVQLCNSKKNEDREGAGLNLQGIWKKKKDQNQGESIARAGLPDTLEGIFFSIGKLWNGVVSLLERTGCWGGGKV